MINFNINAQTELAKEAFVNFISNYREVLAQQLNGFMSSGGPADAQIDVDGDNITIYQYSPDKGIVLAHVEGKNPIEVKQYSDITLGGLYVIPEGDRLMLFMKEEKNTPDAKLGAFKSLNDVVKDINGEGVKTAVSKYNEHKKAVAKDEKRKEKLGKVKSIEAADVAYEEVIMKPSTTTNG